MAAGFDIQNRTSDENFGFVFDAFLKIPVSGNYLFQINSDNGSRMVLDNVTFTENDGVHADAKQARGAALDAGLHRVQIQYFNKLGGRGLTVQWAHAGAALQPIPISALQGVQAQIAVLPRLSAGARLLQRNARSAILTLAGPRNVGLAWVDPSGRVNGYLFQGRLGAGRHEFSMPSSVSSARDALVLEYRP